ncbi:type II toxin-antitoxin system RelE/ParE family toxin [Clostridium perfringens]|uniref:type II toxin-antitoxin system RelE/ParE family toxin n=1 Tax=Clostridium perfringens TaxID=1502 RepID=UPI0013E3A4CF|nr:type II toxin-antitoxin system RelE/ParE family toxin [Clostridium perfringens]EHK2337302.1 hypothetical protein [Clostridium perfringens]EIF5083131.1 hypothetical protein [Clostridium perfringens]MDK0548807.1 type II toxin-antitoxin system RelE/ParE family toxin [Clostridium perfringens]MDK0551250.1 type II toxin-antitoxin system RelE/ParE family toxin [Clostridium perfringens]MDK0833361.1 type II toxin-antitoxin system RelE/ParE family toxin [Clostridium perfringens]
MKLEFKTKKLKGFCENPKLAQKEYGAAIGNKLTQRVNELYRAVSLVDISKNPAARLHRLKGARDDEYTVDLVHPFRLILKPIVDSKDDLNKLELIKIVRIEEVTDYHGKQKRK